MHHIKLPFFPYSYNYFIIISFKHISLAFNFIFYPTTLINIPVCVYFFTFSIHHSIFELSCIFWSIWPSHFSNSLNFIFKKFPFEYFPTICKIITTNTMKHSKFKITNIRSPIAFKFSFSWFLTIFKNTYILISSIIPLLYSLTML